MSKEELEERIFYLKDRFHFIELNREQSEEIVRFEAEQEKFTHLYFSDHETWDYELLVYRDILTTEQLDVYKKVVDERRAYVEKNVGRSIEDFEAEKKNLEKLIQLHAKKIVPSLLSELRVIHTRRVDPEKAAYLRSVYKKFLIRRGHEIIVEHIRYHRESNRAELEIRLLQNRELHVYPSWSLFSATLDAPSTALGDFLYDKIKLGYQGLKEILKQKDQQVLDAQREHQDYIKKNFQGGWEIDFVANEEVEQKNEMMNLILIDLAYYDLNFESTSPFY